VTTPMPMTAQPSTATGELDIRPWVIVLIRANAPSSELTRLRNRQDADDHLRALRRFMPTAQFELMFDPPAQPAAD
jgi:hypothetical protein